jgi:hypothetical protein
MSTDKMFILMLVVLLPLTGCLDAVEPAGAESNDADDADDILTLHIQPNDSPFTSSADRTLKLETMYQLWQDPDCGGGDDGNNEHCPQSWRQFSQSMPIFMECVDGFNMTTTVYVGHFLPLLDGDCGITFNPEGTAKESILIFSSHPVAALGTVF